jgi:hypothetical protein
MKGKNVHEENAKTCSRLIGAGRGGEGEKKRKENERICKYKAIKGPLYIVKSFLLVCFANHRPVNVSSSSV